MKIKIIILITLNFTFAHSFCQRSDSSFQLFRNDVVKSYSEFSKPPFKNYFDVLSNTAKKAFNSNNPLFLKVVADHVTQYKTDEVTALDTIFKQVFQSLNDRSLWISINDLPKNYNSIFQLYYDGLCPCLLSKVSKDAMMNIVVMAQQECMSIVLADTNFLNKLKDLVGENNPAELLDSRQYLALYMYDNCGIVRDKFNEVLYNSVVLPQYQTAIYDVRRAEAEKIFKLFAANKFDSLEIIFPNYKKYSKRLAEVIKQIDEPGVVFKSYYFRSHDKIKNPRTYISLTNAENLGMDVILNNSGDRLNSTVISVIIKKLKKSKKSGKEKSIEIKEDAVISTDKKN